jgi:hypothetical protein
LSNIRRRDVEREAREQASGTQGNPRTSVVI